MNEPEKEKGEVFDPFGAWVGGLEAFCTPDTGDAALPSASTGLRDSEDDQAE